MGYPEGLGVVDCMIGFPIRDRKKVYDRLLRGAKDRESREDFAFPAEYMFKDVPESAGEADDPIDVAFAEMDRFGVETGLFGISPDALEARRRNPKRVALTLEVDPNDVVGTIRKVRAAKAEYDLKAVTLFPAGCLPQVPVDDPKAYTQPFTAWGDSNSYFLAPGGSFEGSNSWSLAGGAQVAAGNEPFYLNSHSDLHSLLLPPGSSATSPAMCLAVLSPHMRLVGKSSDGSGVHVDVYATGLLGLIKLPVSANIALSSSWGPSGDVSLLLQNVLAVTDLGKTSVVFRFSPIGSASVQMDDVYIDPIFHE